MYLYYAIFKPSEGRYSIEFPDLDGAYSFGEDMHDALYMAKDLLEGWLIVAEKEGDPIPEPSSPADIDIPKDALLIPIEVDLELAKLKHSNKLVKKTLTIPQYLNELGLKAGINFSQALSETLKERLNA